MSLDVYLTSVPEKAKIDAEIVGVYVREDGQTRLMSMEGWNEQHPNRIPVTYAESKPSEIYSANITHNLVPMAEAAGIYQHLWRPEELGISRAAQLVEPLEIGLAKLEADPQAFEQYNSPNGWGNYTDLVDFVIRYLAACKRYPDAAVSVWR